jgi:hypothetical protein
MAGEKVTSGDLRLNLNGKTIFHATDCSLSMSRDFKERATKDTTGTERAKGTKSWSASYNGLAVHASDGVNTHDFIALFDLYNDDTATPIEVEFIPVDADATHIMTGAGFIDSLDGTFTNDEDGTISLSIVGSGAMTKVIIT